MHYCERCNQKAESVQFSNSVAAMVQNGKAWPLLKTTGRCAVLLVTVDGEKLKITWDRERKEAASAVPVTPEELSPCDCGHRHCRQHRCSCFVVDGIEPTPCRCDHKCRCGSCLAYDEVKV